MSPLTISILWVSQPECRVCRVGVAGRVVAGRVAARQPGRDPERMVWSSSPPQDPTGVIHRMVDDEYGRAGPTRCGTSTNGLWLLAHTDWADIPTSRRCPACNT